VCSLPGVFLWCMQASASARRHGLLQPLLVRALALVRTTLFKMSVYSVLGERLQVEQAAYIWSIMRSRAEVGTQRFVACESSNSVASAWRTGSELAVSHHFLGGGRKQQKKSFRTPRVRPHQQNGNSRLWVAQGYSAPTSPLKRR